MNRFALEYADRHRAMLNKFEEPEQINSYLYKAFVINKFVQFASDEGVSYDASGFIISEKKITIQLHALIARNILDSKGYYPIILKTDNDLKRALDALRK